ncbi:hypothetical protein HY641_00140 [Candidatus Woesearchaeota archaeon]|nr:hypothetical protein [Candidatus Woesearchaeota archaeon]
MSLFLLLFIAPYVLAEPSHHITDIGAPVNQPDNKDLVITFVLRNFTFDSHPLYNSTSKIPIAVTFNGSNLLDNTGLIVEFVNVYNNSESSIRRNNSLVMYTKPPDAAPNISNVSAMIAAGYQEDYLYDYGIKQMDFTQGNLSYVYNKIINYSDYTKRFGVRIRPTSGRIPSGTIHVIIEADVSNDTDRRFAHSTATRAISIGANTSTATLDTAISTPYNTGALKTFFRSNRWNATIMTTDTPLGEVMLSTILLNKSNTLSSEQRRAIITSANIGATPQIIIGTCTNTHETLLRRSCAAFFSSDAGYANLYNEGSETILLITANSTRMLNKTIGAVLNGSSTSQYPLMVNDTSTSHRLIINTTGIDGDIDGVDDGQDPDDDDDDVADWDDPILGNGSVGMSNVALSATIDGANEEGKTRHGAQTLRLMRNGKPVVEMTTNFDKVQVNLSAVTVVVDDAITGSSIIVNGLAFRKHVHIARANASFDGVCIKDATVTSLTDITATCSATDEQKLLCDAVLRSNRRCVLNESINMYRVEGLEHSAVKQIVITTPSAPVPIPATPVTGAACTSDWRCGSFGECQVNGTRTRSCLDVNYCFRPTASPALVETCQLEAAQETAATTDVPDDTPINLLDLPSKVPGMEPTDVKEVIDDETTWTSRDYYIFGGALLFIGFVWMVMYMLFGQSREP